MGIAIFFYQYSRYTGSKIFGDYAGELIDEIYEEISTTTPLDFENGLAGIGWGIEYLVQKGFIEADTYDVLESIDNQLKPARNQFQGIGLLKGLTGLGAYYFYYLKRMQKPTTTDEKVSTLLASNIPNETILITDDSTSYVDLENLVDKNQVQVITKEKIGEILPWVHLAIANAKRMLLAIHHNIKPEFLQSYLNEFCNKFNRRYFEEAKFDRLLKFSAISKNEFRYRILNR